MLNNFVVLCAKRDFSQWKLGKFDILEYIAIFQ